MAAAPPIPTDAPQAPGGGIDYGRFLDCVHCGLCTAACPTYLETANENDSPRGRIYLMRSVVDGRLPITDAVRRHLDLCLDCRSCETACPSGVQYGRLIEPFRIDLRKTRAARGSWFERLFLHGLFPYPRRMRRALAPVRWAQRLGLVRVAERLGLTRLLPEPLQRMHALLPQLASPPGPLPELSPAIGPRRARVAFFTGCVAEAVFAETNRATVRVLQANGCEVLVPRGQACCGAIHYHGGEGEPALAFSDQNGRTFDSDSVDAIVVNVAGCGSMLKDLGHIAAELAPGDEERIARMTKFADKVRDVSEFLTELGPVAPLGELPIRATYHDACHLAHAQGVRAQPRELLALVPGLELIPLAESDICCGAAGSYNLSEGEMADRLAARKLAHIRATGAEAVVTGNAGCALQIGAAARGAGVPLWIAHPMEILDRAYRRMPAPQVSAHRRR